MKNIFFLPFIGIFLVLIFLYSKGSVLRALKRLGARKYSPAEFTWLKVDRMLVHWAKKQRHAVPELWILPELSPNALAFCGWGGKRYLVLTEGLLQVLDKEELEAAVVLSLCHAYRPFVRLQSIMATNLLPFLSGLEAGPKIFQLLFTPLILSFLRLFVFSASFHWVDREATHWINPLSLAAALQKISVIGQKIPVRRWSLALDHLYLISPLILSGNAIWLSLPQSNVSRRRDYILQQLACERAPTLT